MVEIYEKFTLNLWTITCPVREPYFLIKFIKFFNNLGILNPGWLSSFSVSTLQLCMGLLRGNSEEHQKLNRSWNTAVKIIWDLPHSTHTRFLERLSPVPHLESILAGRFIGFAQNLSKSAKPLIRLLFNLCSPDIGSQTGQNINYLLQKNSKQTLTELVNDRNIVKKTILTPISETESWKLKIIEEVSLVRKGQLEVDFDDLMLDEILDYICTV